MRKALLLHDFPHPEQAAQRPCRRTHDLSLLTLMAPMSSDELAARNGALALRLIRFLLTIDGRISRRTYWIRFAIPLLLLGIAVAASVPPLAFNGAVLILGAVSLWPCIAVGAKRCHDRDRSAWFQLIFVIPVLVLQPSFMAAHSSFPMAAAGALLMSPTPVRPGESGLRIGCAGPHQMPEQPSHLGHGGRQQLRSKIEARFFPRQLRPPAARSNRRAPASPA
jgi:uncharacterized membrane protein YhaH (DUF805 family)